MGVGIETQVGSTAEFARFVEGELAGVEATVARVHEYLADPLGVQDIAPTATTPAYITNGYEHAPSTPIARVPVIPGPRDEVGGPFMTGEREAAAGRRSPTRTSAAVGSAALVEERPAVDEAAWQAAVAEYQAGTGEHPGFRDFGVSDTAVYRPDMTRGKKAGLFDQDFRWDPGK